LSFPDPAAAAEEVSGIRVLVLPKVIELKLASGMNAPHRLRDLADVQEFIKVRQLGEKFASQLDPSVRVTYIDLLVPSAPPAAGRPLPAAAAVPASTPGRGDGEEACLIARFDLQRSFYNSTYTPHRPVTVPFDKSLQVGLEAQRCGG
jgi:hypothetical protein